MSVELTKERLAAAIAQRLPERVKYWAMVEMYGNYLDKEGWTEADVITVAELVSWADSPLASPLKSGFLYIMGELKSFSRKLRESEEARLELEIELKEVREALWRRGKDA